MRQALRALACLTKDATTKQRWQEQQMGGVDTPRGTRDVLLGCCAASEKQHVRFEAQRTSMLKVPSL